MDYNGAMDIIGKLWLKFKRRPDIWLFYAFLAVFPLSVRKVVYFIPIRGGYNEFTGISIYVSDILLVAFLSSWLIVLCNNKECLSINSISDFSWKLARKMFHVEHFFLQSKDEAIKLYTQVIHNKLLLFPFVLVFFSFLSTIWSAEKLLAISRLFKLLEFSLLYVYLWINVPRGTFLKSTLKVIIFTGIAHGLLGIAQFIKQSSIGLFWLKESILSQGMTGIAKIVLNGDIYIRSYGLFPHPNILGGFLLLSLLCTFMYIKLFHVEQFNGEKKSEAVALAKMFHVEHCVKKPVFISLIVIIQIMALFLTFSKSAIFGLFVAIIYIVSKYFSINVPRGTFKWSKRGAWIKFLLVVGIFIATMFILKPEYYSLIGRSVEDRIGYLNVSRGTFFANPILGIGSGQYVNNLLNVKGTLDWQYQPVHNVFLLILNELGLIGLALFIVLLFKLFHVEQFNKDNAVNCSTWNNDLNNRSANVPRGTITDMEGMVYLRAILIGFLFIMLFDHYLWDIQQGQIMFWLVAGLLIGSSRQEVREICIDKSI